MKIDKIEKKGYLQLQDVVGKAMVPYEPKRCNRWIITLPEKFGMFNMRCFSSKTDRPSVNIVDGHVIFNPINISFYDPIGPSHAQLVFDMMVGLTDYDDDSENLNAKEAKEKWKEFKTGFDYKLELLDPCGVVVESWMIYGCKLTNIDFGQLSYTDDSVCEVTITVQPEKWVLLY